MEAVNKDAVQWKDLTHLSTTEKIIENTLCLPWLIGSLIFAYCEIYWGAIPFSAMYFLTALRQSHNGYHNALGIGVKGTRWTLIINSIFMLASLHAIKLNHMEHHEHDLDEDDYERTVADMSWWRALIHGPKHWWHNHMFALRTATRKQRKCVIMELMLIMGLFSVAMLFQVQFLLYHIAVMTLAELVMPFFTVWNPHHGHDEHSIARTSRNRLLNFVTMNMLLHYEHHLFPAVPAIKLGELARRMDQVTVSS